MNLFEMRIRATQPSIGQTRSSGSISHSRETRFRHPDKWMNGRLRCCSPTMPSVRDAGGSAHLIPRLRIETDIGCTCSPDGVSQNHDQLEKTSGPAESDSSIYATRKFVECISVLLVSARTRACVRRLSEPTMRMTRRARMNRNSLPIAKVSRCQGGTKPLSTTRAYETIRFVRRARRIFVMSDIPAGPVRIVAKTCVQRTNHKQKNRRQLSFCSWSVTKIEWSGETCSSRSQKPKRRSANACACRISTHTPIT